MQAGGGTLGKSHRRFDRGIADRETIGDDRASCAHPRGGQGMVLAKVNRDRLYPSPNNSSTHARPEPPGSTAYACMNSDPTLTESKKELAVETNPFLSCEVKGGYLDCGVLPELSRTGMRNGSTRWNTISKSNEKDVVWSREPYTGCSSSWETFSKEKEWFFAAGWETNASIGLYRRLAALLRVTTLQKNSWTEELCGQTGIPEGGRSLSSHQAHKRNNFSNTTWMTGSVGVSCGWEPVQTFLTPRLPMAYLIKRRTKLAGGNGLMFEHAKRDMWQVQKPTTVRTMIIYALTGR